MNFFKGLGKKITEVMRENEIHWLNPFFPIWDFGLGEMPKPSHLDFGEDIKYPIYELLFKDVNL